MGPEEGEYFWAGGNFNNVNAGSVAIRHIHGVDKERNTKKLLYLRLKKNVVVDGNTFSVP